MQQGIGTDVDPGTDYEFAYSYLKVLLSVKNKAHLGFDITRQVT